MRLSYQTNVSFFYLLEWLHPELFDHDTTGVNRYIRMCENLNIQPITYFVKHMQDTELVMKYHGLGPLGVKAMSDPLEVRILFNEDNAKKENKDSQAILIYFVHLLDCIGHLLNGAIQTLRTIVYNVIEDPLQETNLTRTDIMQLFFSKMHVP